MQKKISRRTLVNKTKKLCLSMNTDTNAFELFDLGRDCSELHNQPDHSLVCVMELKKRKRWSYYILACEQIDSVDYAENKIYLRWGKQLTDVSDFYLGLYSLHCLQRNIDPEEVSGIMVTFYKKHVKGYKNSESMNLLEVTQLISTARLGYMKGTSIFELSGEILEEYASFMLGQYNGSDDPLWLRSATQALGDLYAKSNLVSISKLTIQKAISRELFGDIEWEMVNSSKTKNFSHIPVKPRAKARKSISHHMPENRPRHEWHLLKPKSLINN